MIHVNNYLFVLMVLLSLSGQAIAQDTALREGEQVSVSVESTSVMSGADSIGTLGRGKTFKVEQINGSWIRGTHSINGQQVSGWVRASDVRRQASVPTSRPTTSAAERPRDDMNQYQRMQALHAKLIPHYTRQFDMPGLLFGTTSIRQGMPNAAPPADLTAALISFSLYRYASMGLDPATIRAPETERLLATLTDVPKFDDLVKKIEDQLNTVTPAAAEEETAAGQRARMFRLRRVGNYAEAAKLAPEYLSVCRSLFGGDGWQTREAQNLQSTLQRITQLPADAQQQLASADATTVEYQDDLRRMRFHYAKDQALAQYAIRRQHLGEQHQETLDALAWFTMLERLYAGEGSESRHHQLLSAYSGLFPKQHPAVARCLSNLAAVRQDRADFEAAERLLQHALQLRLDATSKSSRFDADLTLLLIRLGRVFEEQGKLTQSVRCAELSRAITRTLTPSARTAIVGSLFDEYASLELRETQETPFYMHAGLAYRPSFSNLAAFGGSPYQTADQVGGTVSSFNELSMAQINSSSDAKQFPHIPYQQATTAYMQAGDYASAERFAKKGVEVAKQAYANRPEDHFRTAIAIHQYAQLLIQIGRSEEGLKVFVESLQLKKSIAERELQKVKQAIAASQNTTYEPLAQTHTWIEMQVEYAQQLLELNKLVEAEQAAREAAKIADIPTTLLPNAFQRSLSKALSARAVLGKSLLAVGKSAEAETVLRSVLKDDFQEWGFSMWNIGRAPQILNGLAQLDLQKGQDAARTEGVAMLHAAHGFVNRSSQFIQQGGAHELALKYASILAETNRKSEAAELLLNTTKIVEQIRRNVGGDEISRARFFSQLTRNDPYSALVNLEMEIGAETADTFGQRAHGPTAAFEFLEQGRGRALLDLLSRRNIDLETELAELQQQRNDPQLSKRIADLKQDVATAKATAARLTAEMQDVTRNPQKLQSIGVQNAAGYIQKLQQQLQQAQSQEREQQQQLLDLARAAREEAIPKPLTAKQASQALGADELLLAYEVSPKGTILLVVQPGDKAQGYTLKWPDGKPVQESVLRENIDAYFEELSREEPQSDASRGPVELYPLDQIRPTLLPDPVFQQVLQARRVFVVADGPLHRLPFEALPADQQGASLLVDQKPAFVYGSSATILLAKPDAAATNTNNNSLLVALGDPAFGDADPVSVSSSVSNVPSTTDAQTAPLLQRSAAALQSFGKLTPLPGTRVEIESIVAEVHKREKNQEGVIVLTGQEATVTKLFSSVRSPRMLHLATHGLAEGGRRAWESALAMAKPAQISANDNGFLNLGDLLARWGGRLKGTELVVLSACRTARGEFEASDGFIALTWGFLYAGSENVIASLWEVDDMATALLMTRLYQNHLGTFDSPRLVNGQTYEPGTSMTIAHALHEAKHWLRTLKREDALAIAQKLRGQDAVVPDREKPYADPFYWAAFVLYSTKAP